MKLLWFHLIFLFPLLAQAQSNGCANMQFQVNQTAFDLASSQTVNPTLVVKANTNPGGCDFFITFDYGQGSSYNNRGLRMGSSVWPIQFSNDSGGTKILKRFPDISSMNDVVAGTLTGGSNDRQANVTYWAVLNMANPWFPAGSYEDNFTATLYKGSPFGTYQYVEAKSIRFMYRAGKRVDISLVPTGGSFNINDTSETLNFGNMATGTTRSCDAVIKYNAGYMLFASSANNGQLKHETLSQYISYTMKFNGVTYSLAGSSSSPKQIYREFGQSPASGLTIPLSATIGSIVGKQGGLYKDTITLTVQSSE